MPRCLAAVLALSVCALQAQAQAFHVHVAPGHDQPGRHAHGPAIHHHVQYHSESDHAVSLTENDEVDGVVMVTIAPAAPVDVVSAEGAVALVLTFEPILEFVERMVALDVRSHGPPSLRRPSYRGPPASKPS